MTGSRGFELPVIGKRVQVTELRESDLDTLYDIESDPETKRHLGGPGQRTREEWIADLKNLLPSTCVLAVVESKTKKLVGRASLAKNNVAVYFGEDPSVVRRLDLVIWEKYLGRRYGDEAARLLVEAGFTQLGLKAIRAEVKSENSRAHKLLDRLGFEPPTESGGTEEIWELRRAVYEDSVAP